MIVISDWFDSSSSVVEIEKHPGITTRDRVTNKEVRRTEQVTVEKVLRERRTQWLGHDVRMEEVCTPKTKQLGSGRFQTKTW